MLLGYVSDEYYAALADVLLEFRSADGSREVTRSSASGGILLDLKPGDYTVILSKPGFGSKRVKASIGTSGRIYFRLLSDRLLGYAWPKWCRAGERVQFRVHA